MNLRVSFIGAGRVGTSMARLLAARGYTICTLVCRSAEKARQAVAFVGAGEPNCQPEAALAADVVFLTVPDSRIGELCDELAAKGLWEPRHTVVHCSGALSTDVLTQASQAGAAVLGLHPMCSVADPALGVKTLPGAHYGLEGCPRGLALGNRIVADLSGVPMAISAGKKAAYHAGAVVASNYLVALMDVALELLAEAGVPAEQAQPALVGLAQGTLANIGQKGVVGALTGPIERGDATTVAAHLAEMKSLPEIDSVYRALGRRTLGLARRKRSTDYQRLAEVAELLSAACPADEER